MKRRVVAVCAGLWLSLGGWAPQDKWIERSAPYVKAALTQPVSGLFTKAQRFGATTDAARLGLAMFAGRQLPTEDWTEQKAQKLADMDARLLPISDKYLDDHPGVSLASVNWIAVLKPTSEDIALAESYAQHFSSDYWLSIAINTRAGGVETGGHIEAFGMGTAGGHPGVSSQSVMGGGAAALDRRMMMTALRCVRAVRMASGHTYLSPREMPTSVYLLRGRFGQDFDQGLAALAADPAIAGTEADACGTAEQFQAYAAMLKSAG